MINRPIKVLIIDDSAVVRTMLNKILSRDKGIDVVGTASNPYEAKDLIVSKKPDVLTLDIEMPRMDGITFLKILMKERPMPVVILSSLSQAGSEIALDALRFGAVEVIGKPATREEMEELSTVILQKIHAASSVGIKKLQLTYLRSQNNHAPQPVQSAPRRSVTTGATATRVAPARAVNRVQSSVKYPAGTLMVLGASTGGTEALKTVLTQFPANMPPIAIVQHIPKYFSRSFANRLNELCQFEVREAVNGDRLQSGLALVAPGDFHMTVHKDTKGYYVQVRTGPQVHHQRPAVDILFSSAVSASGNKTISCILTGMGSDGANGMLELKNAGAKTMVQDEASCVVYGMPRAAYEKGATDKLVSLSKMAPTLLNSLAK